MPYSGQSTNIGIRSMLVLINPRAGWKDGHDFFTYTLQHLLDKIGVVYKKIDCPPHELDEVLKCNDPKEYDAVAVFGGDGSVNAYAYHSSIGSLSEWATKPLLVVPTGMYNSLATSLDITSPDVAIAAMRRGRMRAVPLWEVKLNDHPVTLALGSVSVGLYADICRDAMGLQQWMAEFVSIPMSKRRRMWSTLYNVFWINRKIGVDVTLTDPTTGSDTMINGPMRMAYASQLRRHHSGYSFTPNASVRDNRMDVTMVAETASRMRLAHLFFREAPRCHILQEDGVATHPASKVTYQFYDEARLLDPPAELGPDVIGMPKRHGVVAFVDGEMFPIEAGAKLTVEPTGRFLPIYVP
jgi:diacylglycerol kinase family enzyme